MTILLKAAGYLTSIQDAGRFGYEKFGVPAAGPMDRFALLAVNLLVGNRRDAAGFEFGMGAPELVFGDDCLIAAGGGFIPVVNGRRMPGWMAIFVRRGDTVRMEKTEGGNWGYLAVSGGIAVPLVMGSRSTYLRGKIGGLRGLPLQDGDLLPVCPQCAAFHGLSGRFLPEECRPVYSQSPLLEVVPGPQEERFTQKGLDTFYSNEYRVSASSDRMGYRLEGTPIEHLSGADILSDGMCFGSVQVPASGQPIVMMSEHPTTGGYTKIATVVSADLPLLAQCIPGVGTIRFKTTTPEAAQMRYRQQIEKVERCLQHLEEENLVYIE